MLGLFKRQFIISFISKHGRWPGKPRTDRRCVRELLRRETLDIKEICNIIQLGLVPENWEVIIIHSKESEMKIAPRLFPTMTLEMRF